MPEVSSQRLGRTFEKHGNAREASDLEKAFYRVLDMLKADRNMPPVEEVADLSTNDSSDEVWQGWVPRPITL